MSLRDTGFQPVKWHRLSACALLTAALLPAQIDRVVVVKVDGLPPDLIEKYTAQTAERRGREGRSRLPWIEHVFLENGVWVENFYVRGLSISAPSWSLLDTGRHLEIRGNVEYDRYTLRAYDYLNFFPFYFQAGAGRRADMAGVELLDSLGVPLLADRFPYGEAFQATQLLQRGVLWPTLEGTLKRTLSAGSARQFIDEWQVGWDWSGSFYRENEEQLVRALKDPRVRYLELFSGDYDHIAHLTPDPVTQLHALEGLDAMIGRLWTAIADSPLADRTALVLLSDHGMNTTPGIYSQGFNLVDWFGSREGGAHHVLTNRHPMQEFKIKGLDPFVSAVVTPSRFARHTAGQAEHYPTAMLDLDGNERAGVGLRNNTLNVLHILLDQILGKKVRGAERAATLNAFFQVLNGVREPWKRDLAALDETIAELDARIAERQKIVAARPKRFTPEQTARGLHLEANRETAALNTWKRDRSLYAAYQTAMSRLLALTPADFDPGRFKIADLIPTRSLGPLNSLWDLRNYVTGLAAGGLVFGPDGALDWERSFERVDYFPALAGLRVRNNVQAAVAPQVVDFIATPLPWHRLSACDSAPLEAEVQAVWLYKDAGHEALILRRADGRLRYVPIAGLRAAPEGAITFECRAWTPEFPLGEAARLEGWRTEREWLEAAHQTRYSNAVIGLAEALLDLGGPPPDGLAALQRELRRVDFIVFAGDHWNFNARGFNPGGNHGSFFRASTRSVLMMAGGAATGLPRAARIQTPYDSLSFAPTILKLMGREEPDLPGDLIVELIPEARNSAP
jgi:hypothetical protein